MALFQDPEKRRKCKLRDPDKCPFKVLLAKVGTEDTLYVLLIPQRQTGRAREGKFWLPRRPQDLGKVS